MFSCFSQRTSLLKKIGVFSSVILMALSMFMVTSKSALAGTCKYNTTVKSGDVVILKDQNGKYVGKADSNNYSYYFPKSTTDQSQAGRLVIKNISSDLNDKGVIHLETLDKDVWKGSWLSYDLLGAFAGKTELYYWNDYGSKSDWKVVRPSNSTKTGPIQYGEQVYIVNGSYNEYLIPTDDNWLTTEPYAHTWEFIDYEVRNLNFDRIEYDTDNAVISNEHNEVVGRGTAVNKEDSTDKFTVQLNIEETTTSTFERTEGYEVSVGFSFTAGVPDVASATREVSVSSNRSVSYGEEESFTKSFGAKYEVEVAPHTTEVVEAIATTADIDVPYTMYFRAPNGTIVESCGKWSGTSYYDLTFTHGAVGSDAPPNQQS